MEKARQGRNPGPKPGRWVTLTAGGAAFPLGLKRWEMLLTVCIANGEEVPAWTGESQKYTPQHLETIANRIDALKQLTHGKSNEPLSEMDQPGDLDDIAKTIRDFAAIGGAELTL